MKASEARQIAIENLKLRHKKIFNKIIQASDKGEFEVKIFDANFEDLEVLCDFLIAEGYKIGYNKYTYILSISW